MNKLTLALLLLSTNVFAGGYEHNKPAGQLQGQAQAQGQEQYQGQSQNQNQTGSTATADIHTSMPRVAPSAIAPSVSQYSDCPIVSPASKAGSVFFLSGSGTTGATINGICVAMYLGEIDVMRKIACSNNRDYHDANPSACK